ncbi:MAG: hypothetical protein M0Q13_00660 [Methanothrix sp.]|jgi:hypothetical protein|nr:hypothetical protein [Methanothrix sp.]
MKSVEVISYILIRILVFLIIVYVVAFILIAVARLLSIFDINANLDFLKNGADLNSNDLWFTLGIVALLLLGILLMGIFKAEKGIVILPFEVDPSTEKVSGKAIAEMLITELKRINRIHMVRQYSTTMSHMGEINLAEIQPNYELREKMVFPQIYPRINPEGENFTKNIETIGNFEFGATSLPVGNIMILLKQICPGTDPGLIVTGCLRKYGNEISLAAHMKWKNSSWQLRSKQKNSIEVLNNILPCLVTDLSFQIAFEQLKSKRNDRTQDDDRKEIENDLPSNWRVFKYFTEARESLQKFNHNKDCNELDRARIHVLEASSEEPYFNAPLYLLFSVGIAYLNMKKNDDAEKLARYAVTLRPDSALAWYSWGVTLCFLSLDQEAIRCYNNALKLKDSVEEHNMKADIYFMKARSLRNINRYDEAIKYFLLYFDIKMDNGYVWGHYGITLEAKARKLEREAEKEGESKEILLRQASELRDQAEEAYRKAVELRPKFVSVHAALARIYTKRRAKDEADTAIEMAQRYKWLTREGQNEYNRACFEINCGNKNKARELLRIAIEKKQVNTKWFEVDPDWENVEKEPWFIKLSNEAKLEKKEIDPRISEAAIRRKLDEEEGISENFFSFYDIRDIKSMALKLKSEKDTVSDHLRKLGEKIDDDMLQFEEETMSTKFYPGEIFLENWTLLERQSNSKNNAEYLEKLEKKIIKLLNTFLSAKNAQLYSKTELDSFDRLNPKEVSLINRKLLTKYYAKEIGEGDRDRQTRSELCETIRKDIQGKSEYTKARYHAVCGDANEALSLLQKALDRREINAKEIKFQPDFEFIRNETRLKDRFRDLIDEFSKD